MRPYFAPRPRPAAPRPAAPPPTPAEVVAAFDALVEATRPHWPGGEPTQADLEGLGKRICNRFGIAPEDLSACLLMKALSTPV